ncbi:MAG TPA: c-type cytochrome [Gammaproteobacteria bacterium]|nr:c-type cytochrome [Gammaproteobacteria bacterium]
MKNAVWLLAGAAIVLGGCGDREPAVTGAQADQSVQEAVTDVVSDDVVTSQVQAAGQGGHADLVPVLPADTSASAADEIVESAADSPDSASEEAGERLAMVVGTAGAAGAMLADAVPEPMPEIVDAGATGMTAAQDAPADDDLAMGEKIYGGNCVACHGTGAAGAPKQGDTASWAPRIAQGMKVMTANALNGFKGANGYMPAKGGFSALSDAEVTAAVAYMASESR